MANINENTLPTVVPVSTDYVRISTAGGLSKRALISNLPSSGGGGSSYYPAFHSTISSAGAGKRAVFKQYAAIWSENYRADQGNHDFINKNASGTGSGLVYNSNGTYQGWMPTSPKLPCWVYLNTGTTNSGYCYLNSGDIYTSYYMNAFPGANQGRYIRTALAQLSTATDSFKWQNGSLMTTSGYQGAYFEYTHSANSGKFQCITADNNSYTVADSGITVAAQQFYELEIIDTGTSFTFYIDGSLVATITTNRPANQWGGVMPHLTTGILKTGGSTGTTNQFSVVISAAWDAQIA